MAAYDEYLLIFLFFLNFFYTWVVDIFVYLHNLQVAFDHFHTPIFDTEILIITIIIIIIINYYYHHINIIIIITITTIIIKNKREKGKENTISSMCIVELSLKRPIIYQKLLTTCSGVLTQVS